MPTGTESKKTTKAEKKTVRIFVVLDRSGSMMSRSEDTIDAVNNFLNEQAKDQSTNALVSILLFNQQTEWLAQEVNIQHIDRLELTPRNYRCTGDTALYDAVGKAADEAQSLGTNDGIVVIVTDGQENASREFTLQGVKDIIMQMEQRGWSFIFLGADQNAWQVGGAMGIGAAHGVVQFSNAVYTAASPDISFQAASASVGRYRSSTADLADITSITASDIGMRKVASVLTEEEKARLVAKANEKKGP